MEDTKFTSMIWKNYKPLYNFAMKFTNNPDDADDLFQDTVVKALRFQTQFQDGTNLKSWLFTIMRNTYINTYRSVVKKREVISQDEDLSSVQLVGSAVSNRGDAKFVQEDIKKALDKVPERYRIAFVMCF